MTNFREALSRAFKWAYDPKNRGPELLRTLLVVNPVLMLPMVVLLGGVGPHFWRKYLYSLVIGEVVSLTCFAFTRGVGFIGFRLLKIQVKRKFFILSTLAAMFPGLWLGFSGADNLFRLLRYRSLLPSHPFRDYGTGLVIGSLIFAFVLLWGLWNDAQHQAQRLESETLQAKLSALSAQMNPHLLFNALNTIASTIPSDPLAAEQTTIKLSELYRGILASSKRSSHSLSSELEICRSYLEVESSRFGDRLHWSVECEPGLETVEVPSLLIQPLIENAVKHGLSSKNEGGSVSVRISSEGASVLIRIEDNGVGFGNSRGRPGTGTGLSSCQSRLELFYRGLARFEIGKPAKGPGTRLEIHVPRKTAVPIS